MKTLLVMRHAKSSWEDDSLDDIERPLNERGRKDAPFMGDVLKHFKLIPDVVVSSPAVRTRQTLDGMRDRWDAAPLVRWEDEFYHGGVQDYIDALKQLPASADTALLLGHNPSVESLVRKLCGGQLRMKTSAVACISWESGDWKQTAREDGVLQWLITPKLLRKGSA